ncbi:MAG: hypothetical protein JXA57_20000, partial [Armatimonadetes bacterium]|nr:hypothetical protein [Armatimonadota bacterium]
MSYGTVSEASVVASIDSRGGSLWSLPSLPYASLTVPTKKTRASHALEGKGGQLERLEDAKVLVAELMDDEAIAQLSAACAV